MNQRSERLSPGASHTMSCHCTRRLVLVTVPSFSPGIAAGRKNTSVPISVRPELAALRSSRPLLPEIGGFDHGEVAHDHPVELAEAALDQIGIDGADERVLPEDELALDDARRPWPASWAPARRLRSASAGTRSPTRSSAVASCAVPGLQQAHDVFGEVGPPAGRRRLDLEVVLASVAWLWKAFGCGR